jgi:hypothetical protein
MPKLDVVEGARRRLRELRACAALGPLSACAPDVLARAELDEVCGQPAPIRLLETNPDLPLAGAGHAAAACWAWRVDSPDCHSADRTVELVLRRADPGASSGFLLSAPPECSP